MTTPAETCGTGGFSCGLDATLRIISGKWKPLILFLEADHVLARTDYKEVPPRVDYALTPLGRSLAEAIVPLCTWGTEHMAEMASIFAKRASLP